MKVIIKSILYSQKIKGIFNCTHESELIYDNGYITLGDQTIPVEQFSIKYDYCSFYFLDPAGVLLLFQNGYASIADDVNSKNIEQILKERINSTSRV